MKKKKEYPIHDYILRYFVKHDMYPSPFIRLDAWVEIYCQSYRKEFDKTELGREVWQDFVNECDEIEETRKENQKKIYNSEIMKV